MQNLVSKPFGFPPHSQKTKPLYGLTFKFSYYIIIETLFERTKMMEILEFDKLQDGSVSKQILQILTSCSQEFVPPLCMRSSTLQKDFTNSSESNDGVPYAYFEMIKEQNAFIAEADRTVAGFMSFKKDFVSDIITNEYLPDIYISTVITGKNFRRQGITKGFYEKLSEIYNDRNIFTRTWSTNISHTKLLKSFGFEEFKRIKDDRGKGIDTVYYLKRVGK